MAGRDRQKSYIPDEERRAVLEQFRDWSELPMLVLACVWLVLLMIELIRGLTPPLEILTTIIWGIFVLQFVVELVLAPERSKYLRGNLLMVISLIVPALRIFRIVRVVGFLRLTRAVRGLRLVKVIGSLNRAISGMRNSLGRYRAGYVAAMSITVTLVGAAGMYAFERSPTNGPGLVSYGDALWWTAMIMTTLGSQYWPTTMEGRILGFLLSLYAFGVFGYVTGALASFFIGRDRVVEASPDKQTLKQLQHDIKVLHEELERTRKEISSLQQPPSYRADRENSHQSDST